MQNEQRVATPHMAPARSGESTASVFPAGQLVSLSQIHEANADTDGYLRRLSYQDYQTYHSFTDIEPFPTGSEQWQNFTRLVQMRMEGTGAAGQLGELERTSAETLNAQIVDHAVGNDRLLSVISTIMLHEMEAGIPLDRSMLTLVCKDALDKTSGDSASALGKAKFMGATVRLGNGDIVPVSGNVYPDGSFPLIAPAFNANIKPAAFGERAREKIQLMKTGKQELVGAPHAAVDGFLAGFAGKT